MALPSLEADSRAEVEACAARSCLCRVSATPALELAVAWYALHSPNGGIHAMSYGQKSKRARSVMSVINTTLVWKNFSRSGADRSQALQVGRVSGDADLV